ncbi:MAG TPA: DUF5686 and carboxypeptidase regulatory-like domain-containing protein [Aequorivita sp.]|nr:DUF5686 and carboxypeptidase regulatory-like domain-containing protein [Aequorivita sp.]
MLQKLILLTFLISTGVSAQIVGKVTDAQGQPLPYVNIYIQNSYIGTTTNDTGNYTLMVPETRKTQEYNISFQFLGFKTLTKSIAPTSFPFILNIVLEEETTSLGEVVLNTTEDPAYNIIRKTIAQRKENLEKLSEYTADFYSRGIWKVKNIPEKVFGQKVGDFDGALDSTRTGIVYLSETISKIAFQKPDKFTERIIASKVSGDDNGFSFNSAESANFSFYENTITIRAAVVSPIASNALSYYHYKLEGVFYEGSKLVNKIKVIPRRPNDRVWQGYLYIVEDDWQLYGVDLSTTGSAIQIPFVNELSVKQNYKFDAEIDFWVKISQTIDFGFGLLGMEGDGGFIGVYSNYDFKPEFTKKSFTNEVISFEPQANKKDSLFWKGSRPIPLTDEELSDYIRRDSIQILRQTKPYLDSLDRISNKPSVLSPLTGYSYKNSFEKWSLGYEGPLPKINFNTVQGWNSKAALNFNKWYDHSRTNTFSAKLVADYGLSEDRFRFSGNITRIFNWVDKLSISLSGGSKVSQFNESDPISPLINTISTLFFEKNYMKVYELNYGRIGYSQEVFNGLHLYGNLGFENRQPLFNTTDYVFINNEELGYTSNNPLDLYDYTTAAIEEHNVLKSKIRARINFGQKYFSNPDMRFSVGNDNFPELNIVLTNATSPTEKHYDYTQIEGRLRQSVTLGNKGRFSYLLKGGGFANGDGISFVDYKHFNGDETWLGTTTTYIDIFNLMRNYEFSTNKAYFEGHLEHNFRGWILGKIPGVNQLNFNLVVGAHYLSTETNKPYSEFSIGLDNLGIGKFRMLRLDYVRSFHNGRSDSEIVLGLKFLNIIGL